MDPSLTPDQTPRRKRIGRPKTVLVALAVFAVTIALFYAEENWRGKRAWTQYKLQFEAKGKSLDWADHIPPRVPDEKNFHEAPQMQLFIKGKAGAGSNQSWLAESLQAVADPKELLVARVGVVPSTSGAEPNGAEQAASPAEAAAAIDRRAGRRAAGVVGITLTAKDLAQIQPLQIKLHSEEPLAKEDLEALLPDFSVRSSTSNIFEVTLEKAVSAADYLKSTPTLQGGWAPLVAALERPYARINADYRIPHEAPVPNFVALRTVAQTLAQQAQSFLLLGKPEEALEHLTTVKQLTTILDPSPAHTPAWLVSAMINVAVHGLYVSVVQDGFRLNAWSDAELAALGKQLRSIDLLPLVNTALNTELVAITHTANITPLSELFSFGDEQKKWAFDLLPRGWTYQNMIIYARIMEGQIAAVEQALPLVAPQKVDQSVQAVETGLDRFSPYIYLARIGIPNIGKAIQNTARVQSKARQAEIACALERYRSAHNHYPEDLQELVPQFLPEIPQDIVGGDPMRYRLLSDSEFLLYSIGWNEKDDAGNTGGGPQQGDWVWGEN